MLQKALVLIYLTINLCICFGTLTDKTLEEEVIGVDVVEAVVKKIGDSKIFPDDNGIIKRIAYLESKFGSDNNTFHPGYYGGIWQIEAGDHGAFTEITKHFDRHPSLENVILPAIKHRFGIEVKQVEYRQLLKPFYSGLFARMSLYIVNETIPERFNISGQCDYWTAHYISQKGNGSLERCVTDITAMEKEYETDCQGRMDLAIVLDGSSSMGKDNFELAKQFVTKFIDTFSLDFVNIGFIVFSDISHVIFPLDSNMTSAQLKSAINASSYPAKVRNTDLGLNSGVTILRRAHQREGSPKIMAIYTDGQPNCTDNQLKQALNFARTNNITILATGIGENINQVTLSEMTSHVFLMSSYRSLSESFQFMNSQTCKIPQKPEVGTKITDTLGKREKRFFNYQIPEKEFTIKITNQAGKTRGYYSYEEENPSSAINDGEFTEQILIPPQQPESNRTVFVAIEGLETHNNYTLISEQHNDEGGSTTGVVFLSLAAISTMALILYISYKFDLISNIYKNYIQRLYTRLR